MKYWLTGIIVVLLALAAWFYFGATEEPVIDEVAPPPIAPAERAPAIEPAAAPTPEPQQEALPAAPSEPATPPLPDLADSDPEALQTLSGMVGEASVAEYLAHENVISRVVATVDALGARQIPPVIQAMQGPGGDFAVVADEEPETVIRNKLGDPIPQYVLDPSNYDRYTPYVAMLEAADPAQVAETYRTYRPLLEEAYRQLGYPQGDFGQRLLAVIDQLLATPEVAGQVRLIKPEAYFLFADERLESLTAGQKILLRMGPANAARVKQQLLTIRRALAAEGAGE